MSHDAPQGRGGSDGDGEGSGRQRGVVLCQMDCLLARGCRGCCGCIQRWARKVLHCWQKFCVQRLGAIGYILLGLLFLAFWCLVSSIAFLVTEFWTFSGAMWFSYIAVSTIGYGDFSPSFVGLPFLLQLATLCIGFVTFALVVHASRVLVLGRKANTA